VSCAGEVRQLLGGGLELELRSTRWIVGRAEADRLVGLSCGLKTTSNFIEDREGILNLSLQEAASVLSECIRGPKARHAPKGVRGACSNHCAYQH